MNSYVPTRHPWFATTNGTFLAHLLHPQYRSIANWIRGGAKGSAPTSRPSAYPSASLTGQARPMDTAAMFRPKADEQLKTFYSYVARSNFFFLFRLHPARHYRSISFCLVCFCMYFGPMDTAAMFRPKADEQLKTFYSYVLSLFRSLCSGASVG